MQVAIILNAPKIDREITEDNVIFADAGYKFKHKVKGKNVLLVVGDFDSLKKAPQGENTLALQVEKNFTDGEVAIEKAKEFGATSVSIYGALGGRIDHVLGNISLLKKALDLGLKATIKGDDEDLFIIRKNGSFTANIGQTISIIPFGESCEFLSVNGLYYPLKNLTLTNGDTRGISNVASQNVIEYSIKNGQALVVINK